MLLSIVKWSKFISYSWGRKRGESHGRKISWWQKRAEIEKFIEDRRLWFTWSYWWHGNYWIYWKDTDRCLSNIMRIRWMERDTSDHPASVCVGENVQKFEFGVTTLIVRKNLSNISHYWNLVSVSIIVVGIMYITFHFSYLLFYDLLFVKCGQTHLCPPCKYFPLCFVLCLSGWCLHSTIVLHSNCNMYWKIFYWV